MSTLLLKLVTLGQLAQITSGYADYVIGNTEFEDALYRDPFRHWEPDQLLGYATSKPLLYEPATNWNYAHTNYVLLGQGDREGHADVVGGERSATARPDLPSKKIAIAVAVTYLPEAFGDEGNYQNEGDMLFRRIGTQLAPENAPPERPTR